MEQLVDIDQSGKRYRILVDALAQIIGAVNRLRDDVNQLREEMNEIRLESNRADRETKW